MYVFKRVVRGVATECYFIRNECSKHSKLAFALQSEYYERMLHSRHLQMLQSRDRRLTGMGPIQVTEKWWGKRGERGELGRTEERGT